MEEKYSIQEILSAMNDLNKLKKNKNQIILRNQRKLKLIIVISLQIHLN